MQPTPLRFSEGALAGSFLIILLSLFVIAKIQAWHYSKGTTSVSVAMISVTIEGFVEKPGIYEFPAGTPLEEVLRKAKPKRFADLRTLDLQSPLSQSAQLKIEPLRSLQIHIRGAVMDPVTIEVEPGTRICHLKKIIHLTDRADLTFFKKRNFLSDGDAIFVPEK